MSKAFPEDNIGFCSIGIEVFSLVGFLSTVKLREGIEKNNIKLTLMKSTKRHKVRRFLETITKIHTELI